MNKSNKKYQIKKMKKEKIEGMSRSEKKDWKKSKRERMFMNQETKNQEFNKLDYHRERMHRHHEERLEPRHRHTHDRPKHRQHGFYRCDEDQKTPRHMRGYHGRKPRPFGFRSDHEEHLASRHSDSHSGYRGRLYDRKMAKFGPMHPQYRSGKRQFYNERVGRGREMGFHYQWTDRLGRGLHDQGHHSRHRRHAEEQTMQLLCEKQHLERRLARTRRRLHFVNRQLHAQIG